MVHNQDGKLFAAIHSLKNQEEFAFAERHQFRVHKNIDYSELGGGKGMIKVCIAGTAVKLKNISIVGENRDARMETLIKLNDRLNYLNSFNTSDLSSNRGPGFSPLLLFLARPTISVSR